MPRPLPRVIPCNPRGLLGGLVNHRLVLVGLLLGAACLANLAGIGSLVYKLECVEDKLREIEDLQMGSRLQRLEMQHAPNGAVEPRAVAD